MTSNKEILISLEARYNKLLGELRRRDSFNIEGTLEARSNKNNYQYFQRLYNEETGAVERRYISISDLDLAKKLANKQYNDRLERLLKKRVTQLRSINKDYCDDEIDLLFTRLSPARKEVTTPIEPTQEDRITAWKTLDYPRRDFYSDQMPIYTKKGERVRSTSEKSIADTFYEFNIEYKYEKPLILGDGAIIHPDFTILHPVTHNEIYWEHFDMIDDPDHLAKAVERVKLYELSGISRRDRLVVTVDHAGASPDKDWIKRLIGEYLK